MEEILKGTQTELHIVEIDGVKIVVENLYHDALTYRENTKKLEEDLFYWQQKAQGKEELENIRTYLEQQLQAYKDREEKLIEIFNNSYMFKTEEILEQDECLKIEQILNKEER